MHPAYLLLKSEFQSLNYSTKENMFIRRTRSANTNKTKQSKGKNNKNKTTRI